MVATFCGGDTGGSIEGFKGDTVVFATAGPAGFSGGDTGGSIEGFKGDTVVFATAGPAGFSGLTTAAFTVDWAGDGNAVNGGGGRSRVATDIRTALSRGVGGVTVSGLGADGRSVGRTCTNSARASDNESPIETMSVRRPIVLSYRGC